MESKFYRVWMQDGYSGLLSGASEAEAKRKAIEEASASIQGCAMTVDEKRQATTVDRVTCLILT